MEIRSNTGNPLGGGFVTAKPDSREGQDGPIGGGGEARSTVETG